ncbi:hypothetical protein ES703_75236 [subsurface metagenome]
MKTAPRATCHEYPIVPQTITAKKILWPIAGASAIGYLAKSPIKRVASALETQVANMTAPLSIPAAERIAG